MTVIRTLSKSDSNEQRDEIRIKLEKEYKESNQVLQKLVADHHNDLTRVMNVSYIIEGTITVTFCCNFTVDFSFLDACLHWYRKKERKYQPPKNISSLARSY